MADGHFKRGGEMRILFAAFLCVSSLADATTFRPNDPPFYTMTFEEVENLRLPYDGAKNQLGEYLKAVSQLLRQLESKPKPFFLGTETTLEEASHSQAKWNTLRKRAFEFCENTNRSSHNHQICKDLLAAREKVFLQHQRTHPTN